MSTEIRASNFVLVHVPDSQYPPSRMPLAQVRDALVSGRLAPTALVQVGPVGSWQLASEVVAACPDFLPTRAWPLIGGSVGLSLVLTALHVKMFGTAGIEGPVFLLLFATAFAVVVGSTNSLRTRTARELIAMPILLVPVVAGIVIAETLGVSLALVSRAAHERIEATIHGNPCAAKNISADLAEYGSDEEKSAASDLPRACAFNQASQMCDRLVADLDEGRPAAAEDLRLVGTLTGGDAKARTVVERALRKQLDAGDLKTRQLPCSTRLWDRLVVRVAASASAWLPAPPVNEPFDVSDEMRAALVRVGVSDDVRAGLVARGETAAASAATKTKLVELSGAKSVCDQVLVFKGEQGPRCLVLSKRYEALATAQATRDAALASAKATRDEAKERAVAAQSEARERASDRCKTGCDRFMPQSLDDPDTRWDKCMERCFGLDKLDGPF